MYGFLLYLFYMKTLIILTFAAFVSCTQSSKTAQEKPRSATFEQKENKEMDENIIKLKNGESTDLFVPTRGAVPVRLVFEMKPKQIAELERTELAQEKMPKGLKPGDPMPAYYVLRAKEKGTGELEFFEQPLGAPESSRKSVRKLVIVIE